MRTHLRRLRDACVVALASTVTLTACMTSPPAARVAQEDGQRGALGTVRMTNGSEHYGELLEVRDSAIVILTKGRLAIGKYSDIARMEFGAFTSDAFKPTSWPSAALLARAKRVSRFPYGITAPAMSVLLREGNQTAPDGLGTLRP